MKLSQALRLKKATAIAFVGGGGKTSAVFMAAREMAPALVTTSTHLAARQAEKADRHIIWNSDEPLPNFESALGGGVTLVTGPQREDIARVTAPTLEQLQKIRELASHHNLPLFIEADGSRQKPLKAPAEHEPAIPPFAEVVVITAGMRGLDRPLDENFIHRPEIFGALSGLEMGETVSAEAVIRVLTHPQGGLKNIPAMARRVVLLNQADTDDLKSRAGGMAAELLKTMSRPGSTTIDAVIIASVQREEIHAAHENIAGIVLAAGASSRYGQPKQLLDFHGEPFVRKVAKTALAAGLSPVVVVTGANAELVEAAVRDLPVLVARNAQWREGQAASVRAGIAALDPLPTPFSTEMRGKWGRENGGAIFLLVDQPQVTVHVLEALKGRHAEGLFPIVAPLAADRRANPVLFDRVTFPELVKLEGDVGGRAVMRQFPVEYVPWHDESLLFDVDDEEDYRKLMLWGVSE
jgi:molybdenum cofactor cytidylyltransferase